MVEAARQPRSLALQSSPNNLAPQHSDKARQESDALRTALEEARAVILKAEAEATGGLPALLQA